jgi:hypothetical protein
VELDGRPCIRDYGDLDTCMPHVPLFVCSCKLVYTNSCNNCVVAIHFTCRMNRGYMGYKLGAKFIVPDWGIQFLSPSSGSHRTGPPV